ncbi:hypothetical protein COPRO5265_0619 [Coprothermobacter proteolyticus DSM 5265]|uniref:DUF2232 domain-containing protein n=1 Tax=Coprothermobacter proteolyticus (strain ATCC 35245 / DSM 5265 / OCM 4 / BT) TaxID=309798 RepID=B5Y877_COPPD|nr:DUF2232 domain-containing protein [Coprothermobacter proteolyticus]ACI17842.1 hypothetical protein COPRO5265_0619 [Coprothermobacter proteolyticus DSM 5265]
MRQDSTKAIVESGLMSALAVILVLMGWYLPVVGALISLIAPLPFLVVSAKHGLRYGAITVAVSALISYFLTGDPLIIVSVVLSLGSIGLALGWAVSHGYSAERTLLLGAAVFVIVTTLILYGSQLILHQNILKEMADVMRQSASMLESRFAGTGTATGGMTATTATTATGATSTATSSLKGIAESYKQYADTLESGLMTPALILLGSVLLAFYNYIILKPFAQRLGVALPNLPTMQEIRLPALGVWFIPAALLLMVIKSSYTAFLGFNLYVIGLYYLIFCGMFYLCRILLGEKDNKFVKALFIIGLVFPYFPQVYFLFGIYDCIMRLLRREG